MGLTMADLEDLDIGTILDMITEKERDSVPYARIATQEDFNKF